MLYDVTHRPASLVTPAACGESEWVAAFRAKANPLSFQRTCQTYDEGIEAEVVDSQSKCRLTWTKTGAIIGFMSARPKRDVDRAWEAVKKIMGDKGRPPVFTQGGLMKWRVSLRPETWLLYRRDTGEVDPIDGKPIRVAEYWIDETFTPPKERRSKKVAKVEPKKENLSAMAEALLRAGHRPK